MATVGTKDDEAKRRKLMAEWGQNLG